MTSKKHNLIPTLQIHPELERHGLKLKTAHGEKGLAARLPQWEVAAAQHADGLTMNLAQCGEPQPAYAHGHDRDDREPTSTVNIQW